MEKKCSLCKASLDCMNSESCWCSEYQKFTPDKLNENFDCLCKNCLQKLINDSKNKV